MIPTTKTCAQVIGLLLPQEEGAGGICLCVMDPFGVSLDAPLFSVVQIYANQMI